MEKNTELKSLGEFGLIKHLTSGFFPSNASTVKGIGDDAAIIETKGLQVVWSTDLLTEGVHFDLKYVPLKHLGYKAIVSSISDICAMNTLPTQVLVALAVSNRFSLEALEEFYAGIKLACEKYKVDLVGGDTTTSESGMTIAVSIIGLAAPDKITLRSTARENELLCVTGDLGAAYMGLQILEREKNIFLQAPSVQPDLSGYDYVLERQLKPEARADIVKLLEQLEVRPTSMIDISDGLASEILHLASESDVGFNLYEEKVPLASETIKAASDFNVNPVTVALSGGEDYELLFTIKQQDYEKIKGSPHITAIGHALAKEQGCNLISRSGQSIKLSAQGWDAMVR